MRPGVVEIELHAVGEALAQVDLEAMIVRMARGVQIVDCARVRVRLPEIDRVTGAGSGCADVVQGARREIIYAYQIAEEALVGREGLRHGTRGSVGQVLNVGSVAEVRGSGAPECAREDGQRRLSGQAVVRKRVAPAICLVDP